MDALLATSQAILIWTLLGFLLAWMVTFTVLAFRSNPTNAVRPEEPPILTHSSPVNSAATMLHAIASQSVPVQIGRDRHDTSGDIETLPVA